uniref:Nucleotide-diphospho-sugar transferase domain-containing protein n=1 Tax=Meloidogyne incognita TaxID=6306 RepID=A0A914KZ38_MELIC
MESIPFVLAESDAIWLRNPFEELFPNLNSFDDVDLVLPLNSQSGAIKGQRFAFNPMFAFATNATRLALQRMNKLLNGENSSTSLMDQDVLNELCSSQYSGLVCRDFDRSDIADGAWLKLSETERLRAAKKVGHWPYIVNNNFYVGVHNKMARQAINGLWFLTAKQKLCSLSKARRVLKKYEKV